MKRRTDSKVRIPSSMRSLVGKSLWKYFCANRFAQLLIRYSFDIRGRWARKYVLQMSHGTQQMKRYEPKKYRNEVNTPLRVRSRTIMRLANEDPTPSLKEKIRELYRTYPFFLNKETGINLRLINFYFIKPLRGYDTMKIFRIAGEGEEPNPETDILYWEGKYAKKKSVYFEWSGPGTDEEKYYAVNDRNGEISNVLRFVWEG